jgi:hypothetical protein
MSAEYKLPNAQTARWLRESLTKGPSLTLSQIVATRTDLDQLSFVTFGRDQLSEGDLLEFEFGGKAERADDWLMDRLRASTLWAGGMLIVEDWMASPEAKFINENNLPAAYLDQEVYYVVRDRDPRSLPHWKRIFTNAVPTFHAFVVKDDAHLVAGTSMTREHLKELAGHLRSIICGAYDGESYVIAEH